MQQTHLLFSQRNTTLLSWAINAKSGSYCTVKSYLLKFPQHALATIASIVHMIVCENAMSSYVVILVRYIELRHSSWGRGVLICHRQRVKRQAQRCHKGLSQQQRVLFGHLFQILKELYSDLWPNLHNTCLVTDQLVIIESLETDCKRLKQTLMSFDNSISTGASFQWQCTLMSREWVSKHHNWGHVSTMASR